MANQETRVDNVSAQTVVVAPTQVNLGGRRARGWTEALLQGPLVRVGMEVEATRARDLAERQDFANAAAAFEAIAASLDAHDYAPAAENYRVRAATAHADAGNRADARRLFLELARATLGDGSLDAQSYARRAAEQSESEERWEADGLLARAAWPERVNGDIDAVRCAWDQTKDSESEVEWAAALVELLILTDDRTHAAVVASDSRKRHEIAGADRLSLELDYLDLIEGSPEAKEGWDALTQWAADPRRGIEPAARVWQRRAIAHARGGDLEAAQTAFLHAAERWARDPSYDDQVAEAYFSGLNIRLISGDMTAMDDEGRSIASAMRGSESTATSQAQRLLRQARRALLGRKLPAAFRFSSAAVAVARRAGNFSDFLEAHECLGDALVAAEHPAEAVGSYVAAGLPDKAKALTGNSTADVLLSMVELDGPSWERRAAWAAVAGTTSNASDEAAASIAEQALAEEVRESARAFPTNAAFYAGSSLASVICAVPERTLPGAIALLRDRLELGMGDRGRLAEPFLMLTHTGVSDESDLLVATLLNPEKRGVVHSSQIADLLDAHPDQVERLRAAARAGNSDALGALAFADALGDAPDLVELAEQKVEAAIALKYREVHVEDGVRTVQRNGVGSLAVEGVFARACDDETRDRFVDRLLETLDDTELGVMNRTGAVDALHNLAAALTNEKLRPVIDKLAGLAETDDVLGDFDRLDADEPLARFKIDLAPPNALRAAAIEALSRVASRTPTAEPELRAATASGIGSGTEALLVASLSALRAHPNLAPPSLDVPTLLRAPQSKVRLNALALLIGRDLVAGLTAADTMLSDPDPNVRRQLVGLAIGLGDEGTPLLTKLREDDDCYIRAAAKHRLDQRASPVTSSSDHEASTSK